MANVIDPSTLEGRRGTGYPKPFAEGFAGRLKRALTGPLGLTQFGVNLTTLEPGAMSALRHWHEKEDEFCYVLEGEITLVSEEGEQILKPGMAVAFPAGEPNGHHLINRSDRPAVYLEIGTRAADERAHYPGLDLMAVKTGVATVLFTHTDGTPYD
ncbi:MAG: cupin domain-containing protein [Hyphomicrobiaceae bacterium]